MSNEEKRYYTVNPEDVKAVLDHKMRYAKISRKDAEAWVNVGYLSWTKTGKTLRVMIASR